MHRRQFLQLTAAVATASVSHALAASPATRPATAPASDIPKNLAWHDVSEWGVEGRAYNDTESFFDRLPARAKSLVRPELWSLAHHTTGMSAHFQTDSDLIFVRYTLTSDSLAMPHMPATGVSGVDLYGISNKTWRWAGTAFPKQQLVAARLTDHLAPGLRRYHVNFPLYNGVKSFEIGVARDAAFNPVPPRKDKPVLFYGTSITQGGCASRPGMAFVNILGRRLDRPILNFGFSGNGRTELEVARLLAEIDAAIFVIDTLANTSLESLTQRMVPLVKILRENHPATPILLVEQRPWGAGPLVPAHIQSNNDKSIALTKAFDELRAAGDHNIHYQPGADLIGTDGEGTVDGSHPNDLGMQRYADALEPALRKLL